MTNALLRAAVVRGGRGTYVLRETMARWTHLLPEVRQDVVAFFGCEPDLQWRLEDLLVAIAQAGAEWAQDLPLPAFAHLLHEVPELCCLNRSVWALAASHTQRLRVLDLAVEILTQTGHPMRFCDLLRRVRERRGIGSAWRPRYPAVALGGGLVGLAERDAGIGAVVWNAFRAAIAAKLRAGAFVDPAKLAALLVKVGGPVVNNDVLKGLLAGEQTLGRRVREQARRREPADRANAD